MNERGQDTCAIRPPTIPSSPTPRFIVRRCCAYAACLRGADVRRASSVDWLGQKPAEPAPSTIISAKACHGTRTNGSSPNPMSCRMSPAPRVSRGADAVDQRSRRHPGDEQRRRGCGHDEPGGAEPESAHVVEVDDEERHDDPVPDEFSTPPIWSSQTSRGSWGSSRRSACTPTRGRLVQHLRPGWIQDFTGSDPKSSEVLLPCVHKSVLYPYKAYPGHTGRGKG